MLASLNTQPLKTNARDNAALLTLSALDRLTETQAAKEIIDADEQLADMTKELRDNCIDEWTKPENPTKLTVLEQLKKMFLERRKKKNMNKGLFDDFDHPERLRGSYDSFEEHARAFERRDGGYSNRKDTYESVKNTVESKQSKVLKKKVQELDSVDITPAPEKYADNYAVSGDDDDDDDNDAQDSQDHFEDSEGEEVSENESDSDTDDEKEFDPYGDVEYMVRLDYMYDIASKLAVHEPIPLDVGRSMLEMERSFSNILEQKKKASNRYFLTNNILARLIHQSSTHQSQRSVSQKSVAEVLSGKDLTSETRTDKQRLEHLFRTLATAPSLPIEFNNLLEDFKETTVNVFMKPIPSNIYDECNKCIDFLMGPEVSETAPHGVLLEIADKGLEAYRAQLVQSGQNPVPKCELVAAHLKRVLRKVQMGLLPRSLRMIFSAIMDDSFCDGNNLQQVGALLQAFLQVNPQRFTLLKRMCLLASYILENNPFPPEFMGVVLQVHDVDDVSQLLLQVEGDFREVMKNELEGWNKVLAKMVLNANELF
ncbi:hypothetical protein HDV05_004141 [Chytridiales sp. JEL 0842]|nr:hypothetical protein HDV05_004141 [Chytridiales sp. JEL 0842]